MCSIWVASIGGRSLGSPKSAKEFTNAFPLVCHFQKGILCWGKYAVFGWPPLEDTFGDHQNPLQRSPMHCPWSSIFKKVYHVVVANNDHWYKPHVEVKQAILAWSICTRDIYIFTHLHTVEVVTHIVKIIKKLSTRFGAAEPLNSAKKGSEATFSAHRCLLLSI